jgi:hypothetical protein
LKIDARFATQGRVEDDPLQVVVGLKTDAHGFARSCEAISWRARLGDVESAVALFDVVASLHVSSIEVSGQTRNLTLCRHAGGAC